MSERVRFHLDEHIHPVIAQALRRHGVDVTTTNEVALRIDGLLLIYEVLTPSEMAGRVEFL